VPHVHAGSRQVVGGRQQVHLFALVVQQLQDVAGILNADAS